MNLWIGLVVAMVFSGCSAFNRSMNYVLLVGTGTQLRAFRFIPAQGSLSEVTGSPISIGGTVGTISTDLSATSIFVGESTTNKFKSYTIDPKTLSLSAKSSTLYVDAPGGLCFTSTGGAVVFAKFGSTSDLYHGAYVNSAGTLVINTAIPLGGQGYRCIRRPSNAAQVLYFYGQVDLVTVNSTGIGTIVSQASTGQDGTETPTGDFLVTLDPSGPPQINTYSASSNALTDVNPSSLVVTGATEIERLGSKYYVSTGAQNSVKVLQVSSAGILSLLTTNNVTGTPSVMSADPGENYLAVNAAATGTTTIYSASSSGVLTAVASASTGVASTMVLELVGKRQ